MAQRRRDGVDADKYTNASWARETSAQALRGFAEAAFLRTRPEAVELMVRGTLSTSRAVLSRASFFLGITWFESHQILLIKPGLEDLFKPGSPLQRRVARHPVSLVGMIKGIGNGRWA
jgi:hypothetical protein